VPVDGVTVPLTRAKQRLLDVVLVVARGSVVSVDALVDALWRGAPPASATGCCRTR